MFKKIMRIVFLPVKIIMYMISGACTAITETIDSCKGPDIEVIKNDNIRLINEVAWLRAQIWNNCKE